MKRNLVLMIFAAALFALCGCVSPVVEESGESVSEEEIVVGEADEVTLRCRVAAEEDGRLILAGTQEDAGVYSLVIGDIPVIWEEGAAGAGEGEIEEGSLIEIAFSGAVLECWPMEFGDVREIRVLGYGFDDMCELYLEVLEDLWQADEGLNSGSAAVSVDLSKTSLSPAERSAVRWIFGEECGIYDVLDLTLEELGEAGYLTREENGFTHWEEGVYMAITEKPLEGVYNGVVPVKFDAWKWRSSLGAYYFYDCTANRNAQGQWGDYQVGAHMIS